MKDYLKICMLMVALLILILPVFSRQEHEKIVEEVSVSWWQVPVFALDKSGNPVTDLEPGEVQVQLNGQQIPVFTLHKRSFSVTKPGKEKQAEATAHKQQPFQKKKVVFFLFDQALSTETSISQAKKIAEKIILDTEEDIRFFVLTIDTFAGLEFVGEGSGDNKNQLIEMIKKKVKKRKTHRYTSYGELISNPGKYELEDLGFIMDSSSLWSQRKSMGFFNAFETLYLVLNSIQDNKFIYFFSEGMPNYIFQRSARLSTDIYRHYFKKIDGYLSRGGAVLFIINSSGMRQYSYSTLTSTISGINSLSLLAQESGGTYMEGSNEKITEQLKNMNRAYYEISFPDLPQLKGDTRKISIKSKRKGIKIHSLRTLEKRKKYDQMNSVEKEMLVLNLVTQPDNSLIKGKIAAYNARVDKTKKSKKGVTYTITLPPGYLHQSIDLYKVWLAVDEKEMARVEKIEKESLSPKKNSLKIPFLFTRETKQKGKNKEKTKGETRAYFVLVNQGQEPVRALVHGVGLYQEDPQLLELEKKKTAAKGKKSGQAISTEEMTRILQGAADYCQRLKQSAFHFYCREKIHETRNPLAKRNFVLRQIRAPEKLQIKSYLFGYRLIKQGNKIIEERDWISSSDKKKVKRDQVVKTNAFFSEKAVFAPITILDYTRQDKYNFKFIRFDEPKGRQVAVIEAQPKNPVETATLYGTLWIDMEDFSILKIEAGPKSFRGYWQLKKLADKLGAGLHLSLEIVFDHRHKGIRFPTKVSMLEKYKGGRIVAKMWGPRGLEHTRTLFTYSDYQFFDVKTEVTVQQTTDDR